MYIKKICKLLLPPVLFGLIRYIYRKIYILIFKVPPNYIPPEYSSEIYFNIPDLSKKLDNVWESKNWINHIKKSLKESQTEIPCIHKLAVINACKIVSRMTDYKKIHLIDFGGGCGVLVNPLLSSLQNEKIELIISVIDSKTNIKLGNDNFKNKNINFFDQDNVEVKNIVDSYKSTQTTTILNLSSVLQYIPKYETFLESLLKKKNPMFVCITRFPVCENTNTDAFTIQNITSTEGFCGSIMVNLFGKNSLTKLMDKLGYKNLFNMRDKSSMNYFDKCDDETYRNISLFSYTFLKN
jgi:putative methyltransferase (TIGR04325 family)